MKHKSSSEILRSCACFNLRKASRSVTQFYDEMLQPTGLRSTQLVVLTAIHTEKDLSPSRLARELVMSPSTLSRNLTPLKREGLVEAKKQGARGISLRLTRKGERSLEKALPYWEAAQSRFIEIVGEEGWNELNERLARTLAATRI
jgi:DNA-binding MarR family transcriptional regulator